MASIMRVNPLPARAHGTAACKTPCSWQLVRGTRALSSVRCCQNSRCLLHRVVNGQNSPHCGQADWLPGSKSSQSFNSRPLTSISLLTTFHPLPKLGALLKRTLASIAQNLPSRSGEHQLSLSWPKALIPSSPERLPRRAVQGLGAHSPHQISSMNFKRDGDSKTKIVTTLVNGRIAEIRSLARP